MVVKTNKKGIFDDKNAIEGGGNWFKFIDIGDSVSGTFVSAQLRDNMLSPGKKQYVVTLETEEGLTNVQVKDTGYFQNAIGRMRVGDEVGFMFDKVIPAEKKGMNDTKSIKVYHSPASTPVSAMKSGKKAEESDEDDF